MTRWKREATTPLLEMHAHNQWSTWNRCLLQAADDLGLLVGYRSFPNHWDGSIDREWYAPAAQLARVGGVEAVRRAAERIFDTLHPTEAP